VTGSSGMITPPDPAPSWQWNFDEDTTTISMTNQTPASITNCWKKYGAFASASVSGSNIAYLVSVADLPKTSSNVVANTIATNLVYYTNDVGTSGGLPYSETRDINATVSYFQKVTTGWWEYYLESALILKRWDGAGGFLWK
ncbi:MAG: hypothetical protein NTY53_24740, partial [Kiritimatiellaeota bacterium]|nr:hypothetical protein [Kiritimatiellota bacterium]